MTSNFSSKDFRGEVVKRSNQKIKKLKKNQSLIRQIISGFIEDFQLSWIDNQRFFFWRKGGFVWKISRGRRFLGFHEKP